MKFNIMTLDDNRSGIAYNTKEEFLHEVSMMIDDCISNGGTRFNIAVNADASCFYTNATCTDISHADDITRVAIIEQLDPDSIQIADLAIKKSDIMPQEVPDNLPTAEEYQRRNDEYVKDVFEKVTRQYSEPYFICPACQAGGMCRDESMTYLSYPPKYKYVCNKCGYIDYKSI